MPLPLPSVAAAWAVCPGLLLAAVGLGAGAAWPVAAGPGPAGVDEEAPVPRAACWACQYWAAGGDQPEAFLSHGVATLGCLPTWVRAIFHGGPGAAALAGGTTGGMGGVAGAGGAVGTAVG
jgi:hypothetical protein